MHLAFFKALCTELMVTSCIIIFLSMINKTRDQKFVNEYNAIYVSCKFGGKFWLCSHIYHSPISIFGLRQKI